MSKIDDRRCGLAERPRGRAPAGPSVFGAESENKLESWVDNFRRTHLRLSDRVIGKFTRLQQETRMATTHHCPLIASRPLSSCGVMCVLIEPSSSFDRTMRILIRAYEVGLRLDSMAAYVS
jgi:hypothetical protein